MNSEKIFQHINAHALYTGQIIMRITQRFPLPMLCLLLLHLQMLFFSKPTSLLPFSFFLLPAIPWFIAIVLFCEKYPFALLLGNIIGSLIFTATGISVHILEKHNSFELLALIMYGTSFLLPFFLSPAWKLIRIFSDAFFFSILLYIAGGGLFVFVDMILHIDISYRRYGVLLHELILLFFIPLYVMAHLPPSKHRLAPAA